MGNVGMPYKAVAFDMDGLMLNTEEVYNLAGHRLMGAYGAKYPQELRNHIMGRPPMVCFAEMIRWNNLKNVTPQELAVKSNELYLDIVAHQGVESMPGLETILLTLERRGIRRCVCTSATRRLMEATLSPELRERFEFILTCDDIVHGKPAPEIYLLAALRLEIEPSDMVVLEDSENGCRAGKAAGAMTVAVIGPHCVGQSYEVADLVVNRLDAPEILTLFHEY